MTGEIRRAGAFAAVGSLALVAPTLGRAAALAFLAVAGLAAFVIRDGPLFELFARPGDRRDGKLYGLAGFALAATGLAILATLPVFEMPVLAFVGAVLLLSYGNLGDRLVRAYTGDGSFSTVGFGTAGFAAGAAGMVVAATVGAVPAPPAGKVVFLAASGALLAALLRSVLYERDDPLVMVSVGLLLWFLSELMVPDLPVVAGALAAILAFGYPAYALDMASLPGTLTGLLLGLLTLVLGGLGWFVVLTAFFALGGLSTKYRYEVKLERGVAEDNEGVRGSGNVLGNSAVSLLALLGFAAAEAGLFPGTLAVAPEPFLYAFAGSVAAAMSDTLSSEIGGIFDHPRLITTLEVVEPGTDGGVTWQGELAGLAGAAVVAGITYALLPVDVAGASTVAVAGFVGMTVDSLLGATLEGQWLGNQGVNFFATLAGAAAGAVLAVAVGVV